MLTDKQCKNAFCPEGKARARATDSGGLYLEVAGAGSKRWFWKYRFDGKEKRLALGGYPDLGLKEARVARDDARKQHQSGADPVLTRQVERLSSRFDANASFEVTAREFHATKKVGWSDHYAKRWMERLEKDIFPWLGKLPLSQIGAPMLLQTLRRVEDLGGTGRLRSARLRHRDPRRAFAASRLPLAVLHDRADRADLPHRPAGPRAPAQRG